MGENVKRKLIKSKECPHFCIFAKIRGVPLFAGLKKFESNGKL